MTGVRAPRGRAWAFAAAVIGFVIVGLGLVVLLYRAHLLPVAGVFAAVVLAAGLAGARILVQRRRLVRGVQDLAGELRTVIDAGEHSGGPVGAGLAASARAAYEELRAASYPQAVSSAQAIAGELDRRPLDGVDPERLSASATRLADLVRRLRFAASAP